jgi:hydroxymethylbilane synthase
LGLAERITAAISIDEMLPAVGQGAIAIETRADDEIAIEATSRLNHDATRIACLAERSLLRALGGGCQLPIAAHAVLNSNEITLAGLVANPDGSHIVRERIRGAPANAEEVGARLAEKLISRGANSLLQNFRS